MKHLILFAAALVATSSTSYANAEETSEPVAQNIQMGNDSTSPTPSEDTSYDLGAAQSAAKKRIKSSKPAEGPTEDRDDNELVIDLGGNSGKGEINANASRDTEIKTRAPASSKRSSLKEFHDPETRARIAREKILNDAGQANAWPKPAARAPEPIASATGNNPGVRGGVSLLSSKKVMGSYGLYSPVILPNSDGSKRIFLGGWASSSDDQDFLRLLLRENANPAEIYGPDRIYTGKFDESADEPVQDLKLAFVLKGYHVNDPTIVRPPSEPGVDRSQWLYMYFTMLSNEVAKKCFTSQQDILKCPELFTGHDIGFASSIDGGQSWTFRGIVVAAKNSGDGDGAWMPSVVKHDNELWLYYSTGRQDFDQENTFRLRLKSNGHEKVGAAEPVKIEGFTNGGNPVNIEITPYENDGKRFLLLGNDLAQTSILAYDSEDGLSFRPLPGLTKDPQPKLLVRNAHSMVTPFLQSAFVNEFSAPSGAAGTSRKMGSAPLYLKFLYSSQISASQWELRSAEVNVSR